MYPLAWVTNNRWFICSAALLLASFIFPQGCGEKNIFDCEEGQSGVPCTEKSRDEKIQQAFKDKDYTLASELLEEGMAEQPENYNYYALLGAAYAARAGLDVLSLSSSTMMNGGSSSSKDSGLLQQLNSFVPTSASVGEAAFKDALALMKKSVDTLQSVPESKRADTSGDSFAASVSLQLMLYQSSYSVMYLSKFSAPTSSTSATTTYSAETLSTMTDEDAAFILNNLSEAAANIPGAQGEQAKAMINQALQDIDAQPGDTQKEKLTNYITEMQESGAIAPGATVPPSPTPTP